MIASEPDRTDASAEGTEDLLVLSDAGQLAALLAPERRRLVEELRREPDSAAGLARRLEESRQRLNYHLRELEDAGLLELREERRRGNFTERVMEPTARRFVVDPAALDAAVARGTPPEDRFSATYLVAVAARAIRELADLRHRADEAGKRMASAAVQSEVRLASPAAFRAFVEELAESVAGVVARHHDPEADGRSFRVFTGTYQAPAPDGTGKAGET